MPLIPALQALLDSAPSSPQVDLDDIPGYRATILEGSRTLAAVVAEPPREVGTVSAARIPVEGGEIALRIYQPKTAGPHAIHVYYHGGGWIFGTIDEPFVDGVCRERTALAGFVTVAVEYRLAPEHKFPVPVEDSFAALKWIVAHAYDFDADPARVTIGGVSAGANIAAAVALMARDEDGPLISFQLLEVPAVDLTASSPSLEKYGNGEYPLSKGEVDVILAVYLRSPADATNQYASPLLAADLSGLPPAHIMSSEYDVLRDDGSRYADALNAAGVPATFTLGLGHVHGSSQFTRLLPEAAAWRDEAIMKLRECANFRPVGHR